MKLRVLDLFSGIGGFSLGLERAKCETGPYDGFETVAFCEIDRSVYPVLDAHWPGTPVYSDVRELSAARLAADGIATIDIITGGFPCQDISIAGRGAGLAGARSGLWAEIARLIGELRPAYAIVENSSELLGRGFETVLSDLASLGYDAEWHCIPASYVGAPHGRDRVWIIARRTPIGRHVADALQTDAIRAPNAGFATLSDQGCPWIHEGWFAPTWWNWAPEPALDRVVDGLPPSVDRANGALGNAVVPQIPELIGNAILEAL